MSRKWTKAERLAQSKRMKAVMSISQHADTRATFVPASDRLKKFAAHMDQRNYGYEQIVNAMEWYLLGWDDSRAQK